MIVNKNNKRWFFIILVVYVVLVLSVTLIIREPLGKERIQTEWFLGFKSSNALLIRDNIINVLLFVPIGALVGILSENYKLILPFIIGVFVAETIECSQLIWQLGTFDVDDLLFNTLGAFVGGVLMVIIALVERLNKNSL